MLSSLLFLILFSWLPITLLFGQTKQNTKHYPYGNPVIKHMYTADAAPHAMPDEKAWMVSFVDSENGGGYSIIPNNTKPNL